MSIREAIPSKTAFEGASFVDRRHSCASGYDQKLIRSATWLSRADLSRPAAPTYSFIHQSPQWSNLKANTVMSTNSAYGALFFGGLAICAAALTPARAQNVSDQLNKYGCASCHAVDTKLVGPSFKEIAAKYRGQSGAEKQLVAKVKDGGSGVWGSVPMPPNPTVPDTDLGAMVKWILSQK